ncbi:alpha/beta fold hydrolase [Rhodosalinus sp. FB01]|uniref:alpha/beta fold hydrolase n=1 Tax=Rhodosalinus sp. FB01 TaxID=3239194 RepID=UPI0035260DB2
MAEPLVLLPEFMCDARLFLPQITALGRDRPVTVAPLAGGERVEEIASHLLPQLPQRFALGGLGLGGMVAMEILRRAPDRVARLALMDTEPLAETPAQAGERDPLIVRARSGALDAAVAEVIRPDHLAPGPGRFEVMATLAEMARGLGVEAFTRQIRALQRRRDQQATLRRCEVPTLLLCGAEDTLMPVKRHVFLAELIPGATLRIIDGAGHLPPLEVPEDTTEALSEWLSAPFVLR